LDEITATFEKQKEERRLIQVQIDSVMDAASGGSGSNGGKSSEIGKEREALQQLRHKKGQLIDQKKAIRAQLDIIKGLGDKLVKERKDAKSTVRFNSIAEINAEIAKLQKRQETTSMSLQEEKKLLKEMDALQASKGSIKDLQSKETDLEGVKEKRKNISADIGAKDKEIDAVQAEIDIRQASMKVLSDKESEKRGGLDKLFKEREDLKKAISVTLKEKDAARAEFREKNNEWFNNSRAVKAQKQIQYEAEKKERDEERDAYVKLKEEEEAKKIPYEEEQNLCDYLAGYLERTYIKGGDETAKVATKNQDIVAVKEDPFAGMVAHKQDQDVEYFGKGKGKKKRNRAPKKTSGAGPFTLNVDSFEQFGLLQLSPPTSLDQVEGVIKELVEKREWYKLQPRGSVLTAAQIRKNSEKAAAKLRQSAGAAVAAPVTPTPKGGKFSLVSDEFAPLGKGASASFGISSWGQKAAPAAEEYAAAPAAIEEYEVPAVVEE
jgi:uncharacterized coiled-coil DUF342 family protein